MKNIIIFSSFLLLTISILSCSKDGIQAQKSIKGEWKVVEIKSFYGEFSENGFNPMETISETGELGTFNFTEDIVEFNFTRNDTTFTGSNSWSIVSEKVRQGFTTAPEFELSIDNFFLFEVLFEDSTKNAEKNAQTVTFLETPTSGFGVAIEMVLEKQ